METTRATRTTDKAVSTNRLQESEVETSLAKVIAAVMRENDNFGSKLEGLDAEKGHFTAQKVSSRSSRMIGILETAQEIELVEAGIASKETAQVKMNNQMVQSSELGSSMEGPLQHARMSRDTNSMYMSGMDGTLSYELGHALVVETRGMEAAAAEGSAAGKSSGSSEQLRQLKEDEILTRQIGELKLPEFPAENEEGHTMHQWRRWIKMTELRMQQKSPRMADFMDSS